MSEAIRYRSLDRAAVWQFLDLEQLFKLLAFAGSPFDQFRRQFTASTAGGMGIAVSPLTNRTRDGSVP